MKNDKKNVSAEFWDDMLDVVFSAFYADFMFTTNQWFSSSVVITTIISFYL